MTVFRNAAACALLGAVSLLAGAAHAQFYEYAPACDRACLTGHLDAYLAAQAAHDPSSLPLADAVRATENGVEIAVGDGAFATVGAPTFRLDVVDPEMGAIATNLVVAEGEGHAFQMVRLKVVDGEIAEVETVIGREGESGPMFVPDFATEPSREFLQTLIPSDQMSRLQLLAAADAYWYALETNGEPEYRRAPLLPGTVRIENGLPTTNGSQPGMGGNTPSGAGGSSAPQQFDQGMFVSRTIYDRRFPVVDVERGLVMSIARMGLEQGDYPMPAHWQGGRPILCEIFAIQGGVITAVNVVMKSTVPLEQSAGWPRDPLTRSKSDPN